MQRVGVARRQHVDIGEQKRVIQVEPEPIEVPVREPEPQRHDEPVPVPEREDEGQQVPAR
jgi:hypothetical protein